MTFKSTSQNLSYVARVASASTRPHANGRIDLIPEDAREPEEYYNTLRDQYLAMNQRHQDIRERLTAIKLKLRETMPYADFKKLLDEREALAGQYTELTSELVKLRADVRVSGKDAWAVTFYGIAKRFLDGETMKKIDREVGELLGRPMTEVQAGEAEWSDRTRASKQRGDRRQQARRNRLERERVAEVLRSKYPLTRV